MLEPVVGLFVLVAIALAVRFYYSHIGNDTARVATFERWCEQRQLVLAFRCEPDSMNVYDQCRRLVAPHNEVVNYQGNFPWPNYRYEVEVRAIGENVVALFLCKARVRLARHARPELLHVVEAVSENARAGLREFWLAGPFRGTKDQGDLSTLDRSRLGWHGELRDDQVNLSAMIGKPSWVPPSDTRTGV